MMTMTMPEIFTAQLILATGSRSGLSAPMMDGYYMIGRHDECQIRPKSRSVSRRHCLIYNFAGTMKILDLESASGTHVSGHRIPPKVWKTLKQGDQIRCGKICFNVVLSSGADLACGADLASGGASTSIISGDAFGADDIADFLSSADHEDRQKRYQDIRSNHASMEDSNDEFFDADENLDFTDVTEVADDLKLAEPEPVVRVADSTPILVSASPLPSRVKDAAVSTNQSLATPVQKPARKEKNLAPPLKAKRQGSKTSFNPLSSLNVGGGGAKMIAIATVLLFTLGFLGYQVYHLVSGPEVRILRGID
jgi:predicted component of type VI protein secretion system